jgi:hypothetical protein
MAMDQKLDATPWHDELRRYSEQFKRWTERGEEIVKRYRDERKDTEQSDARFNILWSNVRTLKPAIYARPPKPEVSRRFNDSDSVSRCASTILERALEYEIKQYSDFNSTLSHVVDDRLLPGRGVAWIRYEPIIETVDAEPEITNYVETGGEDYSERDQFINESQEENALAGEEPSPYERIENETSPIDYVYWQDFAHLPARTWDEVTWVARRVYMSLEEGEERFGEQFKAVPLTISPDKRDGEKTTTEQLKKAEVWEIWDKPKKCVYWVARHHDVILDHRDDPLGLEEFFPCPKPYFATISTGSLVPVADFLMYQDQANEIDEITGRIQHLTRSLKVMGIYAADEAAIERLMKEGNDAVMIPVKNWAAFIEKGGLQNAVQFVPLADVVNSLQQLYQARESCKQIIYETTGLSDIIRGASNAAETATAQQIKSQFASLRLNDMKDDMARFARDVLRMKAQIMCSKYQDETLINASGIMHTPEAQLVPQALALLRNATMRDFNIDIETDTLVLIDQQQDKQDRIEFLTAVGGFLQQAQSAAQASPEMLPLMSELLLFGVRGFKIGRTMESSLEQFVQQSKQQAGQQKGPTPEQQKMQAEAQAKQAEMQLEQQKTQAEIQLEQAKLQNAQQMEAQRLQFEQWKVQLDVDTKLAIAQLQTQTQIKQQAMTLNANKDQPGLLEYDEVTGDERIHSALTALIDAANQNMISLMEAQNAKNQIVIDQQMRLMEQSLAQQSSIEQAMSRPKNVVRDPSGRIIGVQ